MEELMIENLEKIEKEAQAILEGVKDEETLQVWKVAYLGRSSALMQIFDLLGGLPKEQRPLIGRRANEVKRALEGALTELEQRLHQQALARALQDERLDVTLPGRPRPRGRLHPATQTLRRIYAIFAEMGFQVYRSREVETDEYNFELLNIPAYHPARDMWDTFHTTTPGILLRTHTSPGQIHVMREVAPEPIRVILPGMVYRYEQVSARKETQFNQVEGLAVGERITFADLKGTLTDFARRMYGEGVRSRFRAAYFPFTEPSAEMDIECFLCAGRGCGVCGGGGWLEVLGCGMVHPQVLLNGGYDPQKFSGYAFGMGSERINMLKHHVQDIRYYWQNDLRFLEQF
jgi:phenylalanyl-tRNA synthetase alpha chain